MATTATNVLTRGFRGTFGKSLVFKTMRGKTFVSPPARTPDKKKESEAQRKTRLNFQEATEWAQLILLDPEKKAYYQQRAKALKLPNAYTAAITDYMRKPKVVKAKYTKPVIRVAGKPTAAKAQARETITYRIHKPGFALNEVKIELTETAGVPPSIVTHKKNDMWYVRYTPDDDTVSSLTLIMIDNVQRETRFTDALI